MRIEKMVLYLLRNKQKLTRDSVREIISAVAKFKNSKVEEAIDKLIKSGDIREKEGRLVVMAKAKRKMIKPDKRQESYGGVMWGRRWTMIIFDIPERDKKKRDILRYQLQKAGFGMMQGSVWVKPFDVAEEFRKIMRSKNLQWQVKVLTFNMKREDEKETLHRIWRLEKLNEEFKEFAINTIKDFKRVKALPFQDDDQLARALDLLARLKEKEFLLVFHKDPQLPMTLLPRDWHGKRAYNLYRQLDKYLVRD
jgi:phenylacetic acid degradation operon negative regulatory protein